MFIDKDLKRLKPIEADGVTYTLDMLLSDPALRKRFGITEIPDPEYPKPADEYYVHEIDEAPYLSIVRKSDEQIAAKKQADLNATSLAYLAATDWMVTRFAETGVAIPSDVKEARQAARDSIVKQELKL